MLARSQGWRGAPPRMAVLLLLLCLLAGLCADLFHVHNATGAERSAAGAEESDQKAPCDATHLHRGASAAARPCPACLWHRMANAAAVPDESLAPQEASPEVLPPPRDLRVAGPCADVHSPRAPPAA
jgi:hypothetical protein